MNEFQYFTSRFVSVNVGDWIYLTLTTTALTRSCHLAQFWMSSIHQANPLNILLHLSPPYFLWSTLLSLQTQVPSSEHDLHPFSTCPCCHTPFALASCYTDSSNPSVPIKSPARPPLLAYSSHSTSLFS